MRVRCIGNRGYDLPKDCQDSSVGYGEEAVFPLIIGKEYTVYGMTPLRGYMWYYINDEHDLYYPVWRPSPLFQVTDGRLSKYWKYNCFSGEAASLTYSILSFEEWVTNPNYYDRLTDGYKEEVVIYNHYKKLMDEEFEDVEQDKENR